MARSRPYTDWVSVVRDTKGRIALRRDAEGKFSNDNVAELYATMVALSKKLKCEMVAYQPDPAGKTPVILERYGNPYLALLPGNGQTQKKARVEKLA